MQVNNLSLMASDLTGPEPVYTEITRIPPQA
jgi:2'-5' RNA ligase